MLNNLAASLLFALLGLASLSASAQSETTIQANPDSSAYAQDSNGAVTRSSSGLCWRTGYWSPGDSVPGCDGDLMPPIVKPTAPDLLPSSTAKTEAAAPLVMLPPPRRCDLRIALQSDDTFAFGKSDLSGDVKTRLENAFRQQVAACDVIETVTVTGHTDRIGNVKNNQLLSERRAAAIASSLTGLAATVRIEAKGAGSSQPLTHCSARLSRAKLIDCLAPDRRATIDVRGQSHGKNQ